MAGWTYQPLLPASADLLAGAGNEYSATGLLGEAHAVSNLHSGSRTYDALGRINTEGFSASVVIERVYEAASLLGQTHAEGFAPTVEVVSPDTAYSATGLLGETHAEGFAATVTLVRNALGATGEANVEGFAPTTAYSRNAIGEAGETQAEGFAPTVTLQRTVVSTVGEVHAEGFAGAYTRQGEFLGQGQLGEAYAQGFAATVDAIGEASAVEPDRGAGSGRFDGVMEQIAAEDRLILDVIKQFVRAA